MRICHFSSLHNRHDTRILIKQCQSLVSTGHDVCLIISDNEPDEVFGGVKIKSVGPPGNMLNRIFSVNDRIYKEVLKFKPDLCIYHDPELCIQAIKLISKGYEVIYDAHEDSPRQYITNASSASIKAIIISKAIESLENYTAKRLTAILTATEGIKSRFDLLNNNVLVIKNYPVINELINYKKWEERTNQLVYIGGLRDTRGILENIEAGYRCAYPLKLAGVWQPKEFYSMAKAQVGWENTEFLGYLDRGQVAQLLGVSKIGLLTLYKTPNHVHSLPVKLYEYMAAGMPVICSDIQLWKEIVERHDCGICVDPLNVDEITSAVDYLMSNPIVAKKMGQNGQKAILDNYSWNAEFKKLNKLIDFIFQLD